MEFEHKSKFVHEAEIKVLAAAVHKTPIYGKKVPIIKLSCQTDMLCSAILFQKLSSNSMKTTLIFLTGF